MKITNLKNPSFLSAYCLSNAIRAYSDLIYGKVLDVGCGNKPYKSFFNNCEYIGLDTHNSGHNHVNTDADFFYNGDYFPFDDNSFDCLVCFQVMEHVDNVDLFLAEIKRVLKPDGLLLASAPFMWPEHEMPYDFKRWTSIGFLSCFNEKNFEKVNYLKSGSMLLVIVSFIFDKVRSRQLSYFKYINYLIFFSVNSFIYVLEKLKLISFYDAKSEFFLDNIIVVKNIK